MAFGNASTWIEKNHIKDAHRKIQRNCVTVFLLIPGAQYLDNCAWHKVCDRTIRPGRAGAEQCNVWAAQ